MLQANGTNRTASKVKHQGIRHIPVRALSSARLSAANAPTLKLLVSLCDYMCLSQSVEPKFLSVRFRFGFTAFGSVPVQFRGAKNNGSNRFEPV